MITPRLKPLLLDTLIVAALIALALWLRAADLKYFVTADEHNWVYRSGIFLNALLQGHWADTAVWLTPGVTTTWLGSAGLAAHYYLSQFPPDEPFLTWLVSFSRNRVDLEVLYAQRWAMAIFTALLTGLVYGLARQLFSRPVALLGTLLMLSGAHLLAVSRIIGHDAPATMFVATSLLAFLCGRQTLQNGSALSPATYGWIILSGTLAGLGVLSKATTLLLIPWLGLLLLADVWHRRQRLTNWLLLLLTWGLVLWLTFVLAWPAAWVSPLGQSWAVISNAFLSSAGFEDADIQPFWTIPRLGPFYYLINGLYKISPVVLLGLPLALFGGWRRLRKSVQPWPSQLLATPLFWLLLFALLYGLLMSLGVKRSPRYILPAFPPLALVAAWGWLYIIKRQWQPAAIGGLALLNVGLTLLYAPYYFT